MKNVDLMDATPFEPYIKVVGDSKKMYAKCIYESLKKSLNDEHKIPEWIISLNGMSGKRYRYFINNLIESIDDARYLEIGSWKGSTAAAAIFSNSVHSVCIDNWSQFGNVREEFLNNIEKCCSEIITNQVYECDFRNVDYNNIGKFNVYFFDGPHEIMDQYDGISLALPALDDEFILIVDDWNDPRPREGTENAIKELGISVLYSVEIRTSNGVDVVYPYPHVLENSDWHNGYYIAFCKK